MNTSYDVVIIGAGPGGYHAAIRCAQLGLSVACIEEQHDPGGECLHHGCIPTKSLLYSSGLFSHLVREGKENGLVASSLGIDINRMMNKKKDIVHHFGKRMSTIMQQHSIDLFNGKGRILSSDSVAVFGEEVEDEIQAKNIIIATGSTPISLPFLEFDSTYILSAQDALEIERVPKKIVIVGAGVIGLEFASLFNSLGSSVTVIDVLDTICNDMDLSLSKMLQKVLASRGISFHLSTEVSKGNIGEGQLSMMIVRDKQSTLINADATLISIGRKAKTDDIGLDSVGIETYDGGLITVNEKFRTTVPNIYAIGDTIEGHMLAHRSAEEGMAVAEIIAGYDTTVNYLTFPYVIYGDPEIASIGLTEQEARESGLEIEIGTCLLSGNTRANCMGQSEGIVKCIAEKKSDRLIGLHILAPSASELIGIGAMALKKHATMQDLAEITFPHPTLSEALREAAFSCKERPMNS